MVPVSIRYMLQLLVHSIRSRCYIPPYKREEDFWTVKPIFFCLCTVIITISSFQRRLSGSPSSWCVVLPFALHFIPEDNSDSGWQGWREDSARFKYFEPCHSMGVFFSLNCFRHFFWASQIANLPSRELAWIYRPACLRLCGLCCLGAAQGKGLGGQRACGISRHHLIAFASLKYITTTVSIKHCGQMNLWIHFSNYNRNFTGYKKPHKSDIGMGTFADTPCRIQCEIKQIIFNNFTRLPSQRT